MDLRSWSFEDDAVVKLDGEWEFYWKQLLTPADFVAGFAPAPAYIPVPRPWNGYETGGGPLASKGYGTYRLILLLPDELPPMAVKIYSAATAHRMWIDGELVATNGVVATTRERAVAQATPRLVGFTPRGGRTEIVVQVSNFHHWRAGLWRSLQLGTASGLMERTERAVAVGAFFLGTILVISLYHVALWFGHRRYRLFLYFGLFSAALTMRALVLGEVLLSRIVPNFSYTLHLQMEYLPLMLGIPTIAAFARQLYPEEVSARFVRWTVISGGAFAAFVLVTPTWIMSRSIIYYLLIVLFPILLYLLYGLVLAVVRRRPMAGSWLLGTLAATAIGANDALYYQHLVATDDLGLAGLVIVVLVQSINLGRRFAQTLRQQELLTDRNRKLAANLRHHLAVLKETRRLATERGEQLRRHIAEGLHGPVQNRLLHVWYQLGRARESIATGGSGVEELIEEARAELDEVRENDIRELSHLLHPAIIQVGLLPALHSLTARYRSHFAIDVEADPEVRELDQIRDNRIPEAIRLAVYRVVEEALANAAHHGHASKVTIALRIAPPESVPRSDPGAGEWDQTREEPHLCITICDDGQGLPPGKRFGSDMLHQAPALSEGGGLGLQLIDGRVGDLGGVWSLTPSQEGGARLQVWLPLPSTADIS